MMKKDVYGEYSEKSRQEDIPVVLTPAEITDNIGYRGKYNLPSFEHGTVVWYPYWTLLANIA